MTDARGPRPVLLCPWEITDKLGVEATPVEDALAETLRTYRHG